MEFLAFKAKKNNRDKRNKVIPIGEQLKEMTTQL